MDGLLGRPFWVASLARSFLFWVGLAWCIKCTCFEEVSVIHFGRPNCRLGYIIYKGGALKSWAPKTGPSGPCNDSTRPGGAPILGQGMAHMILPGPMGPEIGRALSDPDESIRPDGPPNLGHPKYLPNSSGKLSSRNVVPGPAPPQLHLRGQRSSQFKLE